MNTPYSADELNTDDRVKNAVTYRVPGTRTRSASASRFAGGTQWHAILLRRDHQLCLRRGDRARRAGPTGKNVVREVNGPMKGTSPAVLNAWRELANEEECLAIIGPVVTEANLAIVDEVNRVGVPTISFCATFDWAGPYASRCKTEVSLTKRTSWRPTWPVRDTPGWASSTRRASSVMSSSPRSSGPPGVTASPSSAPTWSASSTH